VLKRLLIHASAFNLGLWMRKLFGIGTPRSLQGHVAAVRALLSTLWSFAYETIAWIWNHTASPCRLGALPTLESLERQSATCTTGC